VRERVKVAVPPATDPVPTDPQGNRGVMVLEFTSARSGSIFDET
jgi:hypothetical protein